MFYFYYIFVSYKREDNFIIGSRILPINISFTKYLETKIKEYNYNLLNIDSYALELASSKIKNKLGDIDILTKKVLKKSEKNSKILVEVFVKVKEDITDIVNIIDAEE